MVGGEFMSSLTKELKVRITADTNGLRGALNGINSDISKMSKDFEGLKQVGSKISSVGKVLTAGLTLPIVGAGAASIKTAGDFEASMNKVSAISGATGKDLESLENLAKDMGPTYFNVSPINSTLVLALVQAAAIISTNLFVSLALNPILVRPSVTISEASARSVSDAAAKLSIPGNPLIIS